MEANERPHKRQRLDLDSNIGNVGLRDHDDLDPAVNALACSSASPANEKAHEIRDDERESDDSSSLSNAELTDNNATGQPGMSKNQLKKLRRKERWEAGRDFRKQKRKQKNAEKKERKRRDRDQGDAQEGQVSRSSQPRVRPTLLPVTFLIDCGFDDLMTDHELMSLGSQITRAYSDNHKAQYQAHLLVSSFGGKLKNRFETVLSNHHLSWKGVKFFEADFLEASKQAASTMKDSKYPSNASAAKGPFSEPLAAFNGVLRPEGEVIYLSSESPNTLEVLKPFSTYIVGGLVDKNRHKGICYKKACEKGIGTAKLPISDFMEMQSRAVLATNHVIEIMLRWLECSNWGEAFIKVMPKRKGGSLKKQDGEREQHKTSTYHSSNHDTPAMAETTPETKDNLPLEFSTDPGGEDIGNLIT